MPTLVFDCPLCKAKHSTFDIKGNQFRGRDKSGLKECYELFSICRNCSSAIIIHGIAPPTEFKPGMPKLPHFTEAAYSITNIFEIKGYQSIADFATAKAPEHVPKNIEEAFIEGAKSLAIGCPNAAGVMFRRCVDLMIKDGYPTARGNNLKDKLNSLFADGQINDDLMELGHCIREDGNAAAHNDPISTNDAKDLLDFATELLRQTYTMPRKRKLALQRSKTRRTTAKVP